MRSLRVLKGLVVVGLFLPVLAHAVNVSKVTVQGGMIIGQASPGEKVYVGERLLEQTDSGTFVFGVAERLRLNSIWLLSTAKVIVQCTLYQSNSATMIFSESMVYRQRWYPLRQRYWNE